MVVLVIVAPGAAAASNGASSRSRFCQITAKVKAAASWAFRWPTPGGDKTRYANATATSAFVFFRRSNGMARNDAKLMPFSRLFTSRRHFELGSSTAAMCLARPIRASNATHHYLIYDIETFSCAHVRLLPDTCSNDRGH
jgi:hypothetical protein